MTRLQASGGTIASPYQSEEELKRVLRDLCGDEVFSPTAVHGLYMNLGAIIGQWMSEQQRLEVSSVAGSLLSTAKSLDEASRILSGFETGIHSHLEIEVARRIARYLTLVPGVGSLAEAQELISSFRQEAARIAHVAWWLVPIFLISPRNLGDERCVGTTISRRSFWAWPTKRVLNRHCERTE